MCTASESFVTYLTSLKKIAHLPIQLCGWEHFGYMAGDDARPIVDRGRLATLEYKQLLQNRAQPPGDIEATAQWAADEWLRTTGFQFMPAHVVLHITRAMVTNALTETIPGE